METVFDYYVMDNRGNDIIRCADGEMAQDIHEFLRKKNPDKWFGWGKVQKHNPCDVHLKQFVKYQSIRAVP